MSLQADLLQPELGFFDEEANLTDPRTYAATTRPFGEAHALPPVVYRSKIFSELENEKIWTRGWVPIGLAQQIPNPGDLLPFTLGFHGVHAQRTMDGRIEARFNRHQHGGCRFVPEQCRTGKQTKCTISSCNYTRDAPVLPGRENGDDTPEMYKFVGINPDKLIPVRFEEWGPFIFVNLDPADEQPLIDVLPDALKPFGQADNCLLTLVDHWWMDFKCNWKTFGAAFVEAGTMADAQVKPLVGNAITSVADRAAMGLGEGAPRVEMTWMFPNLLLACNGADVLVVVLQSTGMENTLARVCCLTLQPQAATNEAARTAPWNDMLRAIGARAETAHDRAVKWGTSSLPDTIGRQPGIETSAARHAMECYVLRKILAVHELHWSAPIMDARMMQRR